MSDEVNLRGYRLEVYQDPDDGSWAAEAPDLPGCVAAGHSVAEAMDRIGDAIAAWIESARADGAAVPPASAAEDDYSGRFLLRLPKGLHRQLARQAKREGVSLNQYCANALTQFVTIGQFSEVLLYRLAYDASPYLSATNRVLATTYFRSQEAGGALTAWTDTLTKGNRGQAIAAAPGMQRVA